MIFSPFHDWGEVVLFLIGFNGKYNVKRVLRTLFHVGAKSGYFTTGLDILRQELTIQRYGESSVNKG